MSPSYSVGDTMTDLDEGLYGAVIQSIEPVIRDPNQPQNPAYGDKDQLVITWKLTDVEREDGSDITRRQYVNDVGALTPRSNLYKVFSAVLNNGEPLDKGTNYETEQLIGRSAQIFYGNYVGLDGTTKQKILTVSPAKASKPGSGTIRRKVSEPDEGQIDPDKAIDGL